VLPAVTAGEGDEAPDSEGGHPEPAHDDAEEEPDPELAADPEHDDADPPDEDDDDELDELEAPLDEGKDENDEFETDEPCRATGFSPVCAKRVVGPALELGAYDVQPEIPFRICRTVRPNTGGFIISPSSEHARVGLDC
jgi:hypothetical protein